MCRPGRCAPSERNRRTRWAGCRIRGGRVPVSIDDKGNVARATRPAATPRRKRKRDIREKRHHRGCRSRGVALKTVVLYTTPQTSHPNLMVLPGGRPDPAGPLMPPNDRDVNSTIRGHALLRRSESGELLMTYFWLIVPAPRTHHVPLSVWAPEREPEAG